MPTAQFYDDLADHYDLIYADWETSMGRQTDAISQLLGRIDVMPPGRPLRILDVAAGIGTQTLPLAARGHEVTARDISARAVERLAREAEARNLAIDTGVSDMRDVAGVKGGPFDAVIAMDNSIPHLLSDEEIVVALRGLLQVLAPAGLVILSVRDYEKVDRSPTSVHPYGERTRDGQVYRIQQEWNWLDAAHYRMTLTIEQRQDERWIALTRTSATYYAISIPHLLELMRSAGYVSCGMADVSFFQPVLVGRRPG